MADPAAKLLLFGATGDLSRRMLLPSLYGLHADKLLPPELTITGTARTALDDHGFQAFAERALEEFLALDRKHPETVRSFLERLRYQPLDASSPDGYAALAGKIGTNGGPLAIFLSTAPWLFGPTIQGLESAGLAGPNVRIGLEKPLGRDLESSREINDIVASAFREEQTFRIDHYLGKETVQNILALRFGNSLFEPVWNARGIDHVQITVSETVGLEGRASSCSM